MTIAKQLSNILLAAAVGSAGSAAYATGSQSQNTFPTPPRSESLNVNHKAVLDFPKVLDRSLPSCQSSWLGAVKTCAQTTLLAFDETDIYIQRTNCEMNVLTSSSLCEADVINFGAVSFEKK